MEKKTESPRKRRRLWPWLLAVLAVVFWFAHEPVFVWGARHAIDYLTGRVGVEFKFETVRLHLFQPIEFRNVRFRVLDPPASTTDVTAARIELKTTSLWEMAFGDGRVFQNLRVERLDGEFDFRTPAIVVQPFPTLEREQQETLAAIILRFEPKAVEILDANAVFLADGQSYTIRDVDLDISEGRIGSFRIGYTLIEAGSIRQELSDSVGVATWRDGAVYVSDFRLRDGIIVRDFAANFAHIGGIELTWDVGVEGGTLQGNVVFGSEKDMIHVDLALAAIDLPVEPLPDILALPGKASGTIRDARLTFRANPERMMDAEVAVRLSAEDFQWNDRGWQSLVVGANYIGRRLYLSSLELQQAGNSIVANGEMEIPEDFELLPKTKFLANVAADVRDLTALSSLAGPPFDELAGRFSIHGSLSGEGGQLSGYLNGEASDIIYKGAPAASATASLVAERGEVQVRSAELWAGDDRVTLKGTIGMAQPFRYSGECMGQVADVGVYLPYLGEEAATAIYTGAANLTWQGDGTATSHSGAFRLKLDNAITSFTPTGLTGEIVGTYSPENIYLSTVRLDHGALELNSRVTLSAGGINITDLALDRGDLHLLRGEAYLPLNPFALFEGRPLAEALDLEMPVYANLRSSDLPVADLLQMAGQEVHAGGRLSLVLNASGPLPQLQLSGKLEGVGLTAAYDDLSLPATGLGLELKTGDGRLAVEGSVTTRGFRPMTVSAHMPFAFEETADGVRLFHADAPIAAKIDFPGTSLDVFRPFVPGARRLNGTLAGAVTVSGRLDEPKVEGEVNLSGGDIEVSADTPRVTALNGRARMSGSRIVLESFTGAVGAGPFEASGSIDIADPEAPQVDFHLKGSRILLARDAGLRLRADIDLTARGRGSSGSVTGSVALVDGRIYRRLEVTPLLVRNPVEAPPFPMPVLAGLVPPPYAAWTLDVTVKNAGPFLLVGNLATGEITPELAVRGTLGNPYAVGTIHLRDLQAYLPATTVRIPEGSIHFTQDQPFMPIMDVRARTEVAGYNVQMFAYGAVDQSHLALRSDPPLSEENLIFLLTTGLIPEGMSNAGLGEAAIGQGSIILLRSLARQLEPFGVDFNDFVNRLTVRVAPPTDPTQQSSLMSELRLTDRFSLTSGLDGYGFYNAGLQYTIRFR